MLKFVLLFLLLTQSLSAQSPVLSIGSEEGAPGTDVELSVTLINGTVLPNPTIPDIKVSALQFDLTLSPGLTYVSVTTGPVSTAAGKTASASMLAGKVRVVIVGLNQNAIGTGVVATVRLTIAAGMSAGNKPVEIGGIVASDKDGKNIPTVGIPGSVRVSAVQLPDPRPKCQEDICGTGSNVVTKRRGDPVTLCASLPEDPTLLYTRLRRSQSQNGNYEIWKKIDLAELTTAETQDGRKWSVVNITFPATITYHYFFTAVYSRKDAAGNPILAESPGGDHAKVEVVP